MSCELLGNVVRVNVIFNCISCTGSQKQAITDDSPIIIPYLPAGTYTVDVIAVDISNDIIRAVELIVMSEYSTIGMSPTSGPTTSANLPTTTNIPTTMYTDTPTTTTLLTSDVLIINGATTNVPTTTSISSTTDSPTTGNVHYY